LKLRRASLSQSIEQTGINLRVRQAGILEVIEPADEEPTVTESNAMSTWREEESRRLR